MTIILRSKAVSLLQYIMSMIIDYKLMDKLKKKQGEQEEVLKIPQ